MLEKQQKRLRRHKRVRARIKGTAQVPRLCVFRSNKHIYAQLINDEKGETLIAASDLEINSKERKIQETKKQKIKEKKEPMTRKLLAAHWVGKLIAQKALKKKIKKVVFDRGGYQYHGRIEALAQGAREGGLKF